MKVRHLAVRELIEPKERDIDQVAAHRKCTLDAFAPFCEDRISIQ
ncbi:hypothetical protein ACFV5G_22175 [Streptomyces sp. NPDC059766]